MPSALHASYQRHNHQHRSASLNAFCDCSLLHTFVALLDTCIAPPEQMP